MPLYKVQKRNGAIVDFEIGKIKEAIAKSAEAIGENDPLIPEALVTEVSVELEEKWRDQIPTVEQIQDVGEDVFIRSWLFSWGTHLEYGWQRHCQLLALTHLPKECW